MHPRQHTNQRFVRRRPRFQGLAACLIAVIFASTALCASPAKAETGWLLSIGNLQLDRYVTRPPDAVGVQLPIRKQRRDKLPASGQLTALEPNPNREFNQLWLLNSASTKRSLQHKRPFSGALHAGLRLFRGKRVTGDVYYLTDDAGLPRVDGTKYLLGMSPDQFRFRLRFHF